MIGLDTALDGLKNITQGLMRCEDFKLSLASLCVSLNVGNLALGIVMGKMSRGFEITPLREFLYLLGKVGFDLLNLSECGKIILARLNDAKEI